MTRLLVDPQEKRVGVTGMSILDCCSMFEGMHGNHTVIICENLEIKKFWSRKRISNIRSAVRRINGGKTRSGILWSGDIG